MGPERPSLSSDREAQLLTGVCAEVTHENKCTVSFILVGSHCFRVSELGKELGTERSALYKSELDTANNPDFPCAEKQVNTLTLAGELQPENTQKDSHGRGQVRTGRLPYESLCHPADWQTHRPTLNRKDAGLISTLLVPELSRVPKSHTAICPEDTWGPGVPEV